MKGAVSGANGVSLVVAVMLMAAAAVPARAQEKPADNKKSTLAGVYSEAQASRGETVFKASCLECHVASDYTGDAFASKFVGGTVFDMFEDIRSQMPQSDPGSLSKQQYTDLVAYLFKLNGLPTRSADLPADIDSLKAIKVEAKAPGKTKHEEHDLGVHHGSSHLR